MHANTGMMKSGSGKLKGSEMLCVTASLRLSSHLIMQEDCAPCPVRPNRVHAHGCPSFVVFVAQHDPRRAC